MKIQILTLNYYNTKQLPYIVLNDIYKPQSFDEFDFNIIDLNYSGLWTFSRHSGTFNALDDIKNIFSKIIEQSVNGKIIIMLPQNFNIICHYDYSRDFVKLNFMTDSVNKVLSNLINCFPKIRYEISKTEINDKSFSSDFIFYDNCAECIKKSKGEKNTIVKIRENIYATTLKISQADNFLNIINLIQSTYYKSQSPEWFNKLEYFNDKVLKPKIENLKIELEKIDQELNKNNKFKSILYSSGDELKNVVIEILRDIFELADIDFKDIHHEDFRFEYKGIDFLIETKGVTSNIKFDNVIQCENHKNRFLLEQKREADTAIKSVLIINTQRNLPPQDRESTNPDQIKNLEKREILAIKTTELLKLYEDFINKELGVDECFKIFADEIGEFIYSENWRKTSLQANKDS